MPQTKLNTRQEQFVQELAKGTTQRQAYLLAYPSARKWRDESVDSQASILLKTPKVSQRFSELQRENEERAKLSRDKVLNELKEGAFSAKKPQSYSDKLKALEMIVKIQGYDNPITQQDSFDRAIPNLDDLPSRLVPQNFSDLIDDIKAHNHTEYILKGGRLSFKSTTAGILVPWLLRRNPNMHALVIRQYANTIKDSVRAQIIWSINELGWLEDFIIPKAELDMTLKDTGQMIYYRGAADPLTIKSIKPPFGHIGILLFEEMDQIHGEEAKRNIEQSGIRGGDKAYIIGVFNPPASPLSWANKYSAMPDPDKLVHHSTYLELGARQRLIGDVALSRAEFLKTVNPKAYDNEYLGLANGTGGQVFTNVVLKEITDEQIKPFDNVKHGLDFGYEHPAHYAKCHYDASNLTLYIYGEVRRYRTSNRDMYQAIINSGLYKPHNLMIPDSAEPKSIADYRSYGANVRGAMKGEDSLGYSIRWLQGLKAIIIDPVRCPETAKEFVDYEYIKTRNGEETFDFPRVKDDAIAAVRYATNTDWMIGGR